MNIRKSPYFKWGLTAFLVIVSGIVFYYLMFHGDHLSQNLTIVFKILSPILYGMAIAYLVSPILNFIQYKLLEPFSNVIKWKKSSRRDSILRGISTLLTLLFILGLIIALITILISEIVPSIIHIAENTDTYIDNISIWLTNTLDGNSEIRDYAIRMVTKYSLELENFINTTFIQKGTELIKTVSLSVINVIRFLWNFVLGFIISVYLLAGKEKFTGEAKRLIFAVFRENTANIILNNFKFTHKTFSGFISGKVVDSIIIGLLCFIGTSILGTPYSALVSVLVGVTNIIPFFGPFIGAIPSGILILLVDPMHPLNLVYFVIFILILQQIDGNIIGPKILGSSTGLTGFWVIFAITVFGGLFGVVGILAGVPLFAVIYAAGRAYIETRLANKQLCTESSVYTNINGIRDGEYSTFTPEYMLNKKTANQNQDNVKNLFKDYGNKFVYDIKSEKQVEENSDDMSSELDDVQITSTSAIITEDSVKNQ